MSPRRLLSLLMVSLGTLASACGHGDDGSSAEPVYGRDRPTLTVYSASGLGPWFRSQFAAFTDLTGVTVNLIEGGSGEMVARVVAERSDPKADLLVVLPPFIQQAAQSGLLQPSDVDTTGITSPPLGPAAIYVPIVNNALSFIVSPDAEPQPKTWADLLKPEFKGKLQYSTPGDAGDGTAVLLLLQHLMGKPAALGYLAKLQANNVGPAASTSSLQPKVDGGELWIANGDVQMNLSAINNDKSRFSIFFPAMPDGTRTTVSLPYVAGMTAGSRYPDETQALLTFLLSETAQKSLPAEAFGIPVLDAVAEETAGETGASTPDGLLDGVRVWVPDWTAVLGEIDYDIAAYQKAIGR